MANKQFSTADVELDYMALEVAQHHADGDYDDDDIFDGIEFDADVEDTSSEIQDDSFIEADDEILEVIQRLTETVDSEIETIDYGFEEGTEVENLTGYGVETPASDSRSTENLSPSQMDHSTVDYTELEVAGELKGGHDTEYTGFLSNVSIASRIAMLMAIPLVALATLAVFSNYTLNQNRFALNNISELSQEVAKDQILIDDISTQLLLTLHEAHVGTITFGEGASRLESFKKRFATESAQHGDDADLQRLPKVLDSALVLLSKKDRAGLELFLLNDLGPIIRPVNTVLDQEFTEHLDEVKNNISESEASISKFLTLGTLLAGLGMLLSFFLGLSIFRSISNPIANLSETLDKISDGDLQARTSLTGDNELTVLGDTFNYMVGERIATQQQVTAENEQLNDSVFTLLEAVAELAERDLTVRAQVTEDATGPLADAINELADQTATVLKQVRKIAVSVEAASQMVNRTALSVNKLSQHEQEEAQATANQLGEIVQNLGSVAQSASQANELAGTTSSATQNAQKTVSDTLENMNGIRSNVQETGKRLKRLGERSQEISQIIDVINNLSERTTVLALNASMQAASAGEAGRGFSIIAEEIQRLSENSRESTDRISTLVTNIQQEANATITNMDATIEQVLDGSTLAEDAAQQMQATLAVTTRLVDSVDQIAKSSSEQAEVSQGLQVRADRILESTQSTGQELITLTNLTRKMANYGKQLVKAVNVFKLEM